MNSPQPPDAVRICRFPSQEVEMTSPLRRMRAGLALGTGLALLCACALAAAAQTTGTIRGKVTDATTGRPVDGAQLYVAGTDLGTLSNADGQYQFSVRAGTVELRSRRVGYATATQQVTITPGEVTEANFSLKQAAIGLDVVVVTGTGAETEKRKLGNTVATILPPRDAPRFDIVSEAGAISQPDSRYEPNFGFARTAAEAQRLGLFYYNNANALQPFQVFSRPVITSLFETGYTTSQSASVSGGTPGVTYYVNGRFYQENGPWGARELGPAQDFDRKVQGSASVVILPTDNVKLRVNTQYADASHETPTNNNNIYGTTAEAMFAKPEHDE